jgi:hypothetical protein
MLESKKNWEGNVRWDDNLRDCRKLLIDSFRLDYVYVWSGVLIDVRDEAGECSIGTVMSTQNVQVRICMVRSPE